MSHSHWLTCRDVKLAGMRLYPASTALASSVFLLPAIQPRLDKAALSNHSEESGTLLYKSVLRLAL